jgi:hypothetical protein
VFGEMISLCECFAAYVALELEVSFVSEAVSLESVLAGERTVANVTHKGFFTRMHSGMGQKPVPSLE